MQYYDYNEILAAAKNQMESNAKLYVIFISSIRAQVQKVIIQTVINSQFHSLHLVFCRHNYMQDRAQVISWLLGTPRHNNIKFSRNFVIYKGQSSMSGRIKRMI
jgi:hypothetical protein